MIYPIDFLRFNMLDFFARRDEDEEYKGRIYRNLHLL